MKANSTTSPSYKTLEERLARQEAEEKARRHCHCDGGEVHAHCLSCNARIAEEEDQCPRCKDQSKRRRYCDQCHDEYLRPPDGESVPGHMIAGLCNKCFERQLPSMLEDTGLPRFWQNRTLDNFNAYSSGLKGILTRVSRWAEGDLSVGLYLFKASERARPICNPAQYVASHTGEYGENVSRQGDLRSAARPHSPKRGRFLMKLTIS
jgi:hypothetical protein